MILLKNKYLSVKINELGGELNSVKDKVYNLEYIWQAKEDIWPNHSPVLFPIIARLFDGKYYVDGREYRLEKHGIAPSSYFNVVDVEKNFVKLQLKYDELSLTKYPYKFNFNIMYKLDDNKLNVGFYVENLDDKDIYFSVGGHPAFNCPLFKDEKMEDYFIQFKDKERLETYVMDDNIKMLTKKKQIVGDKIDKLQIGYQLFEKDTVIFEDIKKKMISLKSKNHNKEIRIKFDDFPYLAIWSKRKPNGLHPFVCIEPWYGLPDFNDGPYELSQKPGITRLKKSQSFSCSYSIEFI